MSKSNLRPYADLKAKIREYEGKDGKTKGVYVKIGTLFASEHFNHMFITMEALPVGTNWDGAVSVFKREEAEPSEPKEDKDVQI